MRIYLDAAPIIYTVERIEPYATVVDTHLSASDVIRVTSELTRLECRIKPIQVGNHLLLGDFDEFFAENVSEILQLTRPVIDLATEIRAA